MLILSDVVGSPLDAIGSGPCAPDPTTFAEAWDILRRYGLLEEISPTIRDYLDRGRRGEEMETPKPSDPLFAGVHTVVVAENRTAAEAAAERARALGFHAAVLTTYLEGEAREIGKALAALAKEEVRTGCPFPLPACLILGGETTVTVRGTGQGGRNLEVALGAALCPGGDGKTSSSRPWRPTAPMAPPTLREPLWMGTPLPVPARWAWTRPTTWPGTIPTPSSLPWVTLS